MTDHLQHITLLTTALVCLTIILHQVKGQDVTTLSTADVLTTLSTTPPPLKLSLSHVKSSTSSIKVNWSVPNGYFLKEYRIQATKETSDSLMVSPTFHGDNETDYELHDLMTNSDYLVCIDAIVTGLNNTEYIECISSFTIPVIRVDSVVVLCCVLGYLLLMVLIGYLCWRRAHKKKAEQEAEEEEGGQKTQENGDQSKPILLVSPPTDARPRSVIEDDADIPFITPTWEQIEKENQLRARQGHTQQD